MTFLMNFPTPQGLGLRQSSSAFEASPVLEKAAEDCRTPKRCRARDRWLPSLFLGVLFWLALGSAFIAFAQTSPATNVGANTPSAAARVDPTLPPLWIA